MRQAPSTPTDTVLIQMMLSAEERQQNQAWKSLYQTHYEPKRAAARRYHLPAGVFDDVFQDAVIGLYNLLKAGKAQTEKGSLGGLLWRIIQHRAMNWIRNERPRDYESLEENRGEGWEPEVDTPWEQSEADEEVMERIGRLDKRCQQILTLYYYDQFGMESIATRLQLPNAKAAKMAKSRCLAKLRAYFT